MLDRLRELLSSLFSLFSRPAPDTPAPPRPVPAPPRPQPSQPPSSTAPPSPAPSPPPPSPPPLSDPPPLSHPPPAGAVSVVVEKRGSTWWAEIEGVQVRVGNDVAYGRRRGLMQAAPADGHLKYDPDSWREEFGVWADMIGVTSDVEGKRDVCTINSYDTAGFTFGLMQWGAHTANDNFVLLMRRLLASPRAAYYFPDLACGADGRIARRVGNGFEPLEDAGSSDGLKRYFNSDEAKVDPEEAIAAGKLIHWVRNDPDAEDLLIRFAFEHYKATVRMVSEKVGLDGKTDVEVLVCADIRHQGRGTYAQMREALAKERSVAALLDIGRTSFRERIEGLDSKIMEAIVAGRLGRHRYDAASGEMVRSADPAPSWPEAHYVARARITREDQWGTAKLTEPDAPTRGLSAPSEAKAAALREIALWLNPKASRRYQRQGRTRCNIYAHDFAMLAGAYLPRVWWNDPQLADIEAGQVPVVDFKQTGGNVRELTANDLMRWFLRYSEKYGWRKVEDVEMLQAHANAGGLAVIVGRNRAEGSSGHITFLAPEDSRDEAGQVWRRGQRDGAIVPVLTQAGAENFSFGHLGRWWTSNTFVEHGFWVHD